MNNAIPLEIFKKELFDLLDETFENTQGIYLDRGTALFDTLEALSAEKASCPIGSNGATIAGHVEHMCVYLGVLTDCILRKPKSPVDWNASWRLKEVDEVSWPATQQRLHDAYQTTLSVMKDLEVWVGEDDIGASLAILAHTASHLGAIRQALHSLENAA
jgi:hypothetical protein